MINWKNIQGKECLVLTYNEFSTENEIIDLIQFWLEENVNKISNSFNLVFDCKTSVNYQSMLTIYWKNFIVKIKSKINQIWVLTNDSSLQSKTQTSAS